MNYINKEQFIENFQYFDKEIILEIIDIFINEYPERMKSINDSISSKSFDDIKFHSHSIKGVVANFCAPEVEQQARELEFKGTNKDFTDVEEMFEEFRKSTSALLEELKELRINYE